MTRFACTTRPAETPKRSPRFARKRFAEVGAFASARLADEKIRQGETSQGIELLRVYVAEFRSLNAYSGLTMLLIRAAEVYGANGQVEEALKLLEGTQGMIAHTGGRAFEAEALRLGGETWCKLSCFSGADAWSRRAIDVARDQAAESHELLAATRLARLLRDANRSDEARTILADVYG
jgi:predicted negative regulator of RcsB-dependent stress response